MGEDGLFGGCLVLVAEFLHTPTHGIDRFLGTGVEGV
jgi:hypothetical protein